MSRSRSKSKSRKVRQQVANIDKIWQVFNPDTLRRICTMDERDFAEAYGMTTTPVAQRAPSDFYAFRDNGSHVLAVAHLDTVSSPDGRRCNFVDTESGLVVYSRALDDRLGAYVILDMLPRLGINVDLLLTVGEESGQSTAAFFEPSKEYDWIIEFDRGGTDVVGYQYEDEDWREVVKASGARVGDGIFSDICYLDHLNVKAFNWGVGYRDYHSARSHAFIEDTFEMVSHFMNFHQANAGIQMPHVESAASYGWGKVSGPSSYYGTPITRLASSVEDVELNEEDYSDDDAEFRAWLARNAG